MKTGQRAFVNLFLVMMLISSACGAATEVATEIATPGGGGSPTDQPSVRPTAAQGEAGTWLVMMYEDADDEILEEDIVLDVNEAELVGSSGKVTIVAQVDRYEGGYDGHGNTTSVKRYLITHDSDLNSIGSEELADLGELDMGDKQTLIDFATWAMQTYPADKYAIILSDHGMGWIGGWSDDTPREDSKFTMQDIDEALGTILANTGVDAFEFVGFDACLMGQLEVMSAVTPHARYAVGSEETEPTLGWAYSGFLRQLADNPSMDGGELGKAVVDSYITQ
ncbi:MAG: clostripain-related cysteine peptidase, partial [Chloroflexota bacterium]